MVSYILLFFLLYCYAIWMKSRQPIMKGREGEALVAKTLKRLSTSDYSVLHNVMLRTGTQLTQIDHIIISVYGIFIIDTKHYKGIIIGSMITAGIMMMYTDNMDTKKIMKKGKQMMKKMGIM